MRHVLVAILLASCVHSDAVQCDDGRTCPPDNTCDEIRHTCGSPEQAAACARLPDGSGCQVGTVDGVCVDRVCEPLVCGDGILTGNEVCDGSDLGGADCGSAGFYAPAGLACTSLCTFDTSRCGGGRCGDGILDATELCDGAPPPVSCVDGGYDAGEVGCRSCGADFAACTRFGWRPEATGLDHLFGLSALDRADVWAAGVSGIVGAAAHFDGSTWSVVALPDTADLTAIDALGAADAWALALPAGSGSYRVEHLTAGGASAIGGAPAGVYAAIRAFADDDVYVAAPAYGVLHWNGASWSTLGDLVADVNTLIGATPNDLWVTDSDGATYHWNGAAWSAPPFPGLATRLDELAADDVWAIGTTVAGAMDPVVARWTGTAWAQVPAKLPAGIPPAALVAHADDDVWISTPGGALVHFDGATWATTGYPVTQGGAELFAMRDVGSERIGAAVDGTVYRYTGQVYGVVQPPGNLRLTGFWSDRVDDAYVATSDGDIYHFDGAVWTHVARCGTMSVVLDGSSPSDVWAVGIGSSMHFDGSAWSFVTAPNGNNLWDAGPGDMWFVADNGVYRYDGQTFTLAPIPSENVRAIGGSGPNDVWIAADAGGDGDSGYSQVTHWDGSAFSFQNIAPQIRSLVVVAPNDVFAIAGLNHVLHHTGAGSGWSDDTLQLSGQLAGIDGDAPDDVVATGPTNLFYFDGARWTPIRTDPSPTLGLGLGGVALTRPQVHGNVIDVLAPAGDGHLQFISRLIRTVHW